MSELAILMILESVFPSPSGGGAESQVRTLAMELIGRGQPVEVITPMVDEGSQLASEQIDGIPVTRIEYPKIQWLGAAVLLCKLAWLLVAKREQYQVIHAHIAGNMAAVACLAGKLLNKPVLVKLTGMTEMRGGILDPKAAPVARLRRWAMRRASAYQATSSRIAALLGDNGFLSSKVLNLPNAVDTVRFGFDRAAALSRREALVGHRKLVGVFVGRLEAEKDLDLLISAWADAFKGRQDVALLLVGGGSLDEPLRQLVRQLAVQDSVVFAGPQRHVEEFLGMADFGLLTSQYEGLSNSLLEYMAAKLPVVGSQVSGTEDWVMDGRTGWLFPAGDRAALVQVLRAVDDAGMAEVRRRGEQAHDWIERSASISAVVHALQTTYLQLERRHD
jgi:glycosyltransferase involved in cell wall biosynthesis